MDLRHGNEHWRLLQIAQFLLASVLWPALRWCIAHSSLVLALCLVTLAGMLADGSTRLDGAALSAAFSLAMVVDAQL